MAFLWRREGGNLCCHYEPETIEFYEERVQVPDGVSPRSTNGLDTARDVVISSDGKSVYVAAEEDDAIVRFKRNRRNGKLTPAGCIDDNDPPDGPDTCARSTNGLNHPASLALSPDGKSLYAASEQDDAIVRFKRNRRNGKLTPAGCIDDNDLPEGPDDCGRAVDGLDTATSVTVSPDGRSVYAAAEADDAVVRFKRNRRNGKLTPAGCMDDNDFGTDPSQGEDTCATSTNGLSGASSVVISANGKSLYATAEQDNSIVRFARNRRGALTPRGCVKRPDSTESCGQTSAGIGSTESIVLSHDGKSAYVIGESDGAIVRFKRNRRNGKLTPAGCIEDNDITPDSCARHTPGLAEPSGFALSRDGKSLYVASGDDAVVRFKRNRRNGRLTPKGCIDDNDPPSGPDDCARSKNGLGQPEAVAITRDGRWLYIASEDDDAVVRFRRSRR